MAEKYAEAWGEQHRLSPRQAYAITSVLTSWEEEIADWLRGDYGEPLHQIGPFAGMDLRAMIEVSDNRAWAAKAAERCLTVAGLIESGALPFDRSGCFFDELLMALALQPAQDLLDELPDMFELVPARVTAENLEDDADGLVSDDDWGLVGDYFDDACRWDEWMIPLYRDHPLLPVLLADNHPHTWFDLREPTDGGHFLSGMASEINMRLAEM